jgi:hypothetical protein
MYRKDAVLSIGTARIVELPYIVESETLEGKVEGRFRTRSVRDFSAGGRYGYVLDIDAASFKDRSVHECLLLARTIFVNAVMGFTPHFTAGSAALDSTNDQNRGAVKMYGAAIHSRNSRTSAPDSTFWCWTTRSTISSPEGARY